jgi:hypothetical protein
MHCTKLCRLISFDYALSGLNECGGDLPVHRALPYAIDFGLSALSLMALSTRA